MNRLLIPIPEYIDHDTLLRTINDLERLLPEYMVILVCGMSGSAVIVPSGADYVAPEDRHPETSHDPRI